jgi:uncharacterized damage-inducible protein DinB
MRRAELLAELDSENERWERLLAEVGDDRMDEPGVAGEWSIKDIVAHITAWRRRTVGRFEAVAEGRPEPAPPWPANLKEDDEINAWFHERDRGQSVREVLSESRRVVQQLRAAIAKLPEEAPDDPARFPWMGDVPLSGAALFSHFHDEHEADMRAWLSRQPAKS